MDFARFGPHALRATAVTDALDRGADLGKLQVRTRVLDEQRENTFRRWYPAFRPERPQAEEAA